MADELLKPTDSKRRVQDKIQTLCGVVIPDYGAAYILESLQAATDSGSLKTQAGGRWWKVLSTGLEPADKP